MHYVPASLYLLKAESPYSMERSHLPRVVGPVKEGLALSRAAGEVAGNAILFDLCEVAPYGPPACDLTLVVGATAA